MKMSGYGTEDRSASDLTNNEDGPPEMRTELAKRAMKSGNQRLCRSNHKKNPVILYRYNEYMAYPYAYMVKVAEVH